MVKTQREKEKGLRGLAMHTLRKEGFFIALFLSSPFTPVVSWGENLVKMKGLAIYTYIYISTQSFFYFL